MTDAQAFLGILTGIFGPETHVSRVDPSRGGPPVFVYYFEDVPRKGALTAVTFGLSLGDHPDWRPAKPELIVSLDTGDRCWGQAAAYFAAEYRGERRFRCGDVFVMDEPITEGSGMTGFVMFAPPFLSPEQARIVLPGEPVDLIGACPINPAETVLLREIGLEAFLHREGFDPYDAYRPNLGSGR